MAYQALYRKYRPTTFSDVVGQEHITETLKNQLSSGKIFHAYLFTGTRGTGKTTCAKILARAVNCLSVEQGNPCGKCEACRMAEAGENTDIAEIDAASNNGVDNIRELRDQINFAPASSKFRVYIIDEVHMLTESAFNALLKTLEEPPAHIVFILATTEVHKLPATILSRCQRFDFHRIDSSVIESRLKYVAEQEGLTLTDGGANLIASAADGGMRDALSLLDICVSGGNVIDEQVVSNACGMAGKEYLLKISDAVNNLDVSTALTLLDSLYAASVDMLRLLNELTSHYRDLMIVKTVKGDKKPIVCSASHLEALTAQAEKYSLKDIMRILRILKEIFPSMQSGDRRLQMEMALIRLCAKDDSAADTSDLIRRISALEAAISGGAVIKAPVNVTPAEEEAPAPSVTEKAEEVSETVTEKQVANGEVDCWYDILETVYELCPPAMGVLNGSKAYIDGGFLLIDAPNPLFRSMMNSNEIMRESIKKSALKHLGKSFRLGPYKKATAQGNNDMLAVIANKLKEIEQGGK
ncbi:MAG: DNA polymerase III subunit gamma/tau [Ruminococcaceae bacterium]|nr:DNA polymerase III subunit gamma/tau [Oscillospiraceae bacterium]